MLTELSIKNFAIIGDIHISFAEGFTILSGETGTGKSIIINAVNLLLGSRASAKLIRSGAEMAELEALFNITAGSRTADILEKHGYFSTEGLLVRRIIARNQRHKVYINGRLATMQILNAITENLASISGQHAHQNLLKEDFHLLTLDQFGGLMDIRNTVGDLHRKLIPLIERAAALKATRHRQAEQKELFEFQKAEIAAVDISLGEDDKLEQEKIRLKNAEQLYRTAYESLETIYSADGSIMERLGEIAKNLEKMSGIEPEFKTFYQSIADTTFQLEEMAGQFQAYMNKIQIDDHRREWVEERLDQLNKIKRKYGGNLEEVLRYDKNLDEKLAAVENISDQITETENEIETLSHELKSAAMKLSEERKKTAQRLSASVEKELATLKMPQTRFQVTLQTNRADENTASALCINEQAITETGMERASFLIAPNIGESLKPLITIASGGELSRVILALKAILAQTDSVETIVFDEVDAGIGGGVAEMVGKKLTTLSQYHQVICITHLAQIAKFAHDHFIISKYVKNGRTQTRIHPVSGEDRINEIARMLGGVEITDTTLQHAREMMKK